MHQNGLFCVCIVAYPLLYCLVKLVNDKKAWLTSQVFFFLMLPLVLLVLVFNSVIVCNMTAPRTRREGLLDQLASQVTLDHYVSKLYNID